MNIMLIMILIIKFFHFILHLTKLHLVFNDYSQNNK